MSRNLTGAVTGDRAVSLYFPSPGYLAPPILQLTECGFAYPGCQSLFKNLELGLDMDSRICLVGPNGAGKMTLTKLLVRELESTTGYVALNAHCTIARFRQHFVDQIDLSLSPLEFMRSAFLKVETPEPLRSEGSRLRCERHAAEQSDGDSASRVVLAWMAFRQPHLMILDEPTNHLDIESIDALADVLNMFEGAVVVVSHVLRLIAQIAEEIWAVKGTVTVFRGACRARSKR